MTGVAPVATVWSLHIPDPVATRLGLAAACSPALAHEVLGRKGLLAKGDATRLAMCAVHRAVGGSDPPPPRPDRVQDDVGVVVATNLSNVEDVRRVTRITETDGWRDVSLLDAPNASPNVVASSIAIRFGFGGPNLTVAGGAPAGLDALRIASLLITARRARRVVVVGVEPADGAACVVLEAGEDTWPAVGRVEPCDGSAGGEWQPAGGIALIGVVLALARVAGHGAADEVRVVAGSDQDGWRAVTVSRVAPVVRSIPA